MILLSSLYLGWVLARKYDLSGRTWTRMHHDVSAITVQVMLSSKKDFAGGEFYLYGSDNSIKDKVAQITVERWALDTRLTRVYNIYVY